MRLSSRAFVKRPSIKVSLRPVSYFSRNTLARVRPLIWISVLPCPQIRELSTLGTPRVNPDEVIEEDGLPSFTVDDYYPMGIGDVINGRYQAVTKFGFGVNSTVWLCRDLREQKYLTLKVQIRVKGHDTSSAKIDRETVVSEVLASSQIEHPGKKMIRRVVGSFHINTSGGNQHQCTLYEPLGMSYATFRQLFPKKKLPRDLTQKTVQLLLIGLDSLHQHHISHTDISPNNVLQGVDDATTFSAIEREEAEYPSPRRTVGERSIYRSRPMPVNTGLPVLCDFGEARVGNQKHTGDVMPGLYRAPKAILGMEWDTKVDIWAMGLMTWDLLQRINLFFATKDGLLNDEQHLAELVSLIGPPPKEFLARSEKCQQYWDSEGNWKGSIPIPEQSFEIRERWLDGEEQAVFLAFMRRVLCWLPEERPTASELAYDDFLMELYNRPPEAENGQE